MLWCKTIYSLHQIILLGGCHTTSEDGVISSPRCFKGRVSSTYTLSLARHPCNYKRTPPLWRTHICNCEGAWMARVIFTFFNWRHARSYSGEVSGRPAGGLGCLPSAAAVPPALLTLDFCEIRLSMQKSSPLKYANEPLWRKTHPAMNITGEFKGLQCEAGHGCIFRAANKGP